MGWYPPHTSPEGTSLVTKLHAPITQSFPIVTPGKMTVLNPIKQLSPILIFPNFKASLYCPFSRNTHVPPSCVEKTTSDEIVT